MLRELLAVVEASRICILPLTSSPPSRIGEGPASSITKDPAWIYDR
jgi:hypothetical protein